MMKHCYDKDSLYLQKKIFLFKKYELAYTNALYSHAYNAVGNHTT